MPHNSSMASKVGDSDEIGKRAASYESDKQLKLIDPYPFVGPVW
jgi:hypothetical protein